MDILIEFCRSGRLGPLDLGLDLVEVQELIGAAETSHELHGEPDRQRHAWGNLSVLFRGAFSDTGDRRQLKVTQIRIGLEGLPVRLPGSLAETVTADWSSNDLDAVLAVLEHEGLPITPLQDRQAQLGGRLRTFAVGDAGVRLVADDNVATHLTRTRASAAGERSA